MGQCGLTRSRVLAGVTPAWVIVHRGRFSACGKEGLTRHDALHALGAVLARHIGQVLQPGGGAGDVRGRYVADLEGLSMDSWRQRFAGDGET